MQGTTEAMKTSKQKTEEKIADKKHKMHLKFLSLRISRMPDATEMKSLLYGSSIACSPNGI